MRELVENQPMKVAAAEALFEIGGAGGVPVFATGDFSANPGATNREIKIPHVLSLLATHSWNGEVAGRQQRSTRSTARSSGRASTPRSWRSSTGRSASWSTRGARCCCSRAIGLWLWRKGKLETSRRFLKFGIWAGLTPFLINTAGWVMTEMGRQPWIVQGLLRTEDANSPRVSTGQLWLTLIGFVLLFTVLGGIALWVFLREARHVHAARSEGAEREEEGEFALAY